MAREDSNAKTVSFFIIVFFGVAALANWYFFLYPIDIGQRSHGQFQQFSYWSSMVAHVFAILLCCYLFRRATSRYAKLLSVLLVFQPILAIAWDILVPFLATRYVHLLGALEFTVLLLAFLGLQYCSRRLG